MTSPEPFEKGPKPGNRNTTFFDDAMVDQLLRTIATVTMELSVTRERLDLLERYLAAQGVLDETLLEGFKLGDVAEKTRSGQRMKLVQDVFGPLTAKLASD